MVSSRHWCIQLAPGPELLSLIMARKLYSTSSEYLHDLWSCWKEERRQQEMTYLIVLRNVRQFVTPGNVKLFQRYIRIFFWKLEYQST